MTTIIDNILDDSELWKTINNVLPAKRKHSGTNFININCPMCVSRGESADQRQRCGIKRGNDGIGIYCFNCGFKTRWQPGKPLGKAIRDFLENLGVSSLDIKRLAYQLYTINRLVENSGETIENIKERKDISFKEIQFPKNTLSLTEWANNNCNDPDFISACEYLVSRGKDIENFCEYYWSNDTDHNIHKRLIIPMYHDNKLVGWSGRTFDNKIKPKYFSNVQTDFIFNNRVLKIPERKFVLIVEGIFDAIAVDGISTLGGKLSKAQIEWINNSGKTPILLADRDSTGKRVIDIANQNNWHVSFPRLRSNGWWEHDVKDAADAVLRYGKLYTIRSILETATNNKFEITIKQKMII